MEMEKVDNIALESIQQKRTQNNGTTIEDGNVNKSNGIISKNALPSRRLTMRKYVPEFNTNYKNTI